MQDIYVGKLKMILGTAIQFTENCLKRVDKVGEIEGKNRDLFEYIARTLQELRDKL